MTFQDLGVSIHAVSLSWEDVSRDLSSHFEVGNGHPCEEILLGANFS